MAAPPAHHMRNVASDPGWHWLTSAAEMAAAVSRGWAGQAVHDPVTPGCVRLPRVATRTPGVGAESVRAARAFTVATLDRWGVTERSEDIVLVVSELMTNALRHAVPQASRSGPHRPLRLGLLQPGACVLCAVADPSDQVPAPRDPGQLDETGRGLYVIASLSDDWGCTMPGPLGKVVWATFLTGPAWLPAPPLADASLPLASAPLWHRPPDLAASRQGSLPARQPSAAAVPADGPSLPTIVLRAATLVPRSPRVIHR